VWFIVIQKTVFVRNSEGCEDTKQRTSTWGMMYPQQYLFTVVIHNLQMWSSQWNFTYKFLSSFITCVLSLTLLLYLLVNYLPVESTDRMSVVSVLTFHPTRCTVDMYCPETPLSPTDVRPDVSLTSGVRRQSHPTDCLDPNFQVLYHPPQIVSWKFDGREGV
jgi:hypothetical protein